MNKEDVESIMHTKCSLHLPGQPVLKDLFIISVRWSEMNTFYGLALQYFDNNNDEQWTQLDEVDAKFVRLNIKQPVILS